MAFPTVEATATSAIDGGSGDRTVDLPAGITAGDLLVVFYADADENTNISWPSGWTELAEYVSTADLTQDQKYSVGYRLADGSEGSTITITTDTTGHDSTHQAYRISGAADPSNQAPEISAKAEGNSSNPDPPSLTPTGGSKDYLWLAACSTGFPSISSAPSNYTNLIQANESSVDSGSAERQLAASSEDPGTFTIGNSAVWIALTVAIHPADTGGTTVTRTLDDSFTQQETLNRDFDGNRVLDDSQTLTENLTDAAIRNRNLSDSFTFADDLIRDVVLTRLLSDSSSLTENLNRNFWGDRLLSDDETLTENLTRTITQQGQTAIRRISDTFTFAENLIRDQILTRLPTENFSLSEGFRNLINGDVIGAGAARRFISQFSNFIEDQTLDDNVVKDFVDGIFS